MCTMSVLEGPLWCASQKCVPGICNTFPLKERPFYFTTRQAKLCVCAFYVANDIFVLMLKMETACTAPI